MSKIHDPLPRGRVLPTNPTPAASFPPSTPTHRDGAGRSPEEQELCEAIRAYQDSSGRLFPTWSEVLEVLEGLGYRKQARPR